MEKQTLKLLSQAAFWGAVASVAGSALIYLRGQVAQQEGRNNAGVFVGLWAPSLFTLSEMLDRISEEDESYMGLKVERNGLDRIREKVTV